MPRRRWPRPAQQHPGIDRDRPSGRAGGGTLLLINPYAYAHANLSWAGGPARGGAAGRGRPDHFVYASSSSVYGANTKLPFSLDDPVDRPLSLYAATKRADELISQTYAHLYRLPMTGLRFFTVYGPWGRPDMATYLLARQSWRASRSAVQRRRDEARLHLYRRYRRRRGGSLDRPPPTPDEAGAPTAPTISATTGPKACGTLRLADRGGLRAQGGEELEPMQAGDVPATYADIAASARDLGFEPKTPIDVGIPKFVKWFRTESQGVTPRGYSERYCCTASRNGVSGSLT